MSVDRYLAMTRETDQRHELVDGYVVAMAGASERHNQIAAALTYLLYGQLLQRPCQVFQSDMRVQADEKTFFYPDIVAVCDEALYRGDARDTLLNPAVVIEVLSHSTEDYDRGRKFKHYRTLSTLTDYVLVIQSHMRIEQITRQQQQTWLLQEFTQPDDAIALDSIQCTLTLRDVYQKVQF